MSYIDALYTKSGIQKTNPDQNMYTRLQNQYRGAVLQNTYANPSVQFGKVNNQFRANSNPIYQTGTVPVTVNGETLYIPNAMAQNLQFQAGVNQGNYDIGTAFGTDVLKREAEQGRTFSSYGAAQGQANQIINNSKLLGNTSRQYVSPYDQAVADKNTARNVFESFKTPQVFTEQRNAQGVAGNNAANSYNEALQAYKLADAKVSSSYFNNQKRARAGDVSQELNKVVDLFKTPTTANVAVKETLIK